MGPGGGQCDQRMSQLSRAIPGLCSVLEPGSPTQPSEMVLPSLSLQLVADATSSRSGHAAHPSFGGTSVF